MYTRSIYAIDSSAERMQMGSLQMRCEDDNSDLLKSVAWSILQRYRKMRLQHLFAACQVCNRAAQLQDAL